VPPELAHIALRCLRRDKSERYASVDDLTRDIADWLEGLAPWRRVVDMDFTKMPDGPVPGCTVIRGDWHVEGGRLRTSDDPEHMMVLDDFIPGDVRVEMEAMVAEGEQGEISALLMPAAASTMGYRSLFGASYALQFGGNANTCARIRKSLSTLATVEAFCERNRWYHVSAERTGDVLRLVVDGKELVRGRDLYPMATERVGLYNYFAGLSMKRLRVLTRGASTVSSCLEVPRAFHARGLVPEAREEYLRIAGVHPGRDEGLEALFHAGRCDLDLAAKETDPAKRETLLDDAWSLFHRLEEGYLAPLGCLGKSFVWESRRQLEKEAEELVRAHREYPHHDTLGYVSARLWERVMALRYDPRCELFLFPAVELNPVALIDTTVWDTIAEMIDPSTGRRILLSILGRCGDRLSLQLYALGSLRCTLAREGRYEEAIDTWKKETSERDIESLPYMFVDWDLQAAKIRYRQGRFDDAIALARRILSGTRGGSSGSGGKAIVVIAESLLLQGRHAEAIAECNRLLSNPSFSPVFQLAWAVLARIHVARKDYAEAERWLDRMGDTCPVLHARALVRLAERRPETAKECLEQAVLDKQWNPGQRKATDGIALIESYGRDQVKALYILACIHALEGDREKVLEILERLSWEFVDWAARAALHPDDAHAVERARLYALDILWRKRRLERAAALAAWARTGDTDAFRRIEEWARDEFDNFADALRTDVEYL
jgi:tetratricopeptide (TPR) repeat protein